MHQVLNIVVIVQHPFKGISQAIEKERRGVQAKGEAKVHVKMVLPFNTEKFPILLTNWVEAKGMLNIELGHESICTMASNQSQGEIKGSIV